MVGRLEYGGCVSSKCLDRSPASLLTKGDVMLKSHKGEFCWINPNVFCQEGVCERCYIYTTCSVDGCENDRYAKGLCRKHYARFHRYGTTEKHRLSPLDRFYKYSIEDISTPKTKGNHCWVWTSTITPQGYGRFSVNGKQTLAHRFSYETFVGVIPIGKELDHLCRNQACVNPDHLEAVTHSINLKRGDIEAMSHQKIKTHCPQGHPYREENTYIDKNGYRSCRQCHNDREKVKYQRSLKNDRDRTDKTSPKKESKTGGDRNATLLGKS